MKYRFRISNTVLIIKHYNQAYFVVLKLRLNYEDLTMKISRNFDRSEFACKCGCGQDTVDADLLDMLETLRRRFGQPITITSGNRCAEYNAKIGGAKNSQHLYGRAADIVVKDVTPKEIYNALNAYLHNRCGLGLYSGWVHVDTRTGVMSRWDETK